jgi:hypothetical protein
MSAKTGSGQTQGNAEKEGCFIAQGDAVVALYHVPHNATRNENPSGSPRYQLYFRVTNARRAAAGAEGAEAALQDLWSDWDGLAGSKTVFFSHLYIKLMILPRQGSGQTQGKLKKRPFCGSRPAETGGACAVLLSLQPAQASFLDCVLARSHHSRLLVLLHVSS